MKQLYSRGSGGGGGNTITTGAVLRIVGKEEVKNRQTPFTVTDF